MVDFPDTTRFLLGLLFFTSSFCLEAFLEDFRLNQFQQRTIHTEQGLSIEGSSGHQVDSSQDPILECEAAKKVVRTYGGFLSHGGTSIAGWFIMENPSINRSFGVPLFQESSISKWMTTTFRLTCWLNFVSNKCTRHWSIVDQTYPKIVIPLR